MTREIPPTGGHRPTEPRGRNVPRSRSVPAARAARPGQGPRQRPSTQTRPTSRPVATPHSLAPTVGKPEHRQRILTLFTLLVMVIFAYQLFQVQVVNAAELSADALRQRLVTREVVPARAEIVDRDGLVLATSVERFHIAVNQKSIADFKRAHKGEVLAAGPADAAEILAPILGISAAELAPKMMGESTWVYLAKDVTPEIKDLVMAERITGIDYEKTTKRIYPGGNLAGNIIGFMGGDAERPGLWGMAGVEYAFEDYLLGVPGTRTYERSFHNTVIPAGVYEETPAEPGKKIQLTIDRDIQYYTQQILEEAVQKTGATHGTVVVWDTQASEILALADSGSVDPNQPADTPASGRGSRAVSAVFEPGSTAKVITVAAALEEKLVQPTSQFVVPYEYTTSNGQTFRDSHRHPDQRLTVAGVMSQSSNTGTIQIGQLLPPELRHKYLQKFGFGRITGVGLPGESAGILHDWKRWDGRTTYAVLYGQGVSITALQSAQVFAIVANQGKLIQPTIVRGFLDEHDVLLPRETAAAEQVISADTAAALLQMLEGATNEGTGVAARIDGYRVAGKTGTAEAPDESGQLNSIVASFVGIAPADNPRLVVSVVLHDPKTSIWGGEVAAPVFKDVTSFALQSLGVAPSKTAPQLYPTTWE